MAWFKCNLVDSNILKSTFYDLRLSISSGDPAQIASFSTDESFSLQPKLFFNLTQTGSGTPSATNPRDYVYTEQIVLTHAYTLDGGSSYSSSYTMNMNFKLFAGTLYPTAGHLTTTLFGVDMGSLTYTQRSTGVLQVNKDDILSATGHNMARYNAAAVYCPVATINSQTTNQIRLNSNVTAANAASAFSGHYLIYELASGIFDAHFGTHLFSITANSTNTLTMTGAPHNVNSVYYVMASVKKHLNI